VQHLSRLQPDKFQLGRHDCEFIARQLAQHFIVNVIPAAIGT